MQNTIRRIWKGEAKYIKFILYIPLFFLSYLYGKCLLLREYMYKTGMMKVEEAPIPVISIGNISLGGTGKTPIVEKLAAELKKEGFNPGIITRGYKRKRKGIFSIDAGKDSAEDVGDEAMMLAKKGQCPVIVSINRARAIDEGIKTFKMDVALLDDGFQLKNIKKDIEILVINGKEGRENNALFPLGPCREPFERIKEADIILVNKGDLDNDTKDITKGIPAFKVKYKPAYLYNLRHNLIANYNFLKGKNVLAFSGLGDNESFFNLLRDLGANVIHEIAYPDHYAYKQIDIKRGSSFEDIDLIVTTEKDAVKIVNMEVPENLFYLSIEVVIEREQELLELIFKRLKTKDEGRGTH
jgi:tetraacyldisaccharide 4'-kinase